MKLQHALFEKILFTFKKKSEAITALSILLNVQSNAIYKRIRGDTPLTPDELTLLVQHFNISIDALLNKETDIVLFSYPSLVNKPKNFADYLNNLSVQIAELPKVNGYIKYASAEIPIYHYCFFPEIIAFKLFTWGKTTWNFDYLQGKPFSLDLMSPTDYEAAATFLHHYLKVPSIELWSANALDNTLSQLIHCIQSGNMKHPSDGIVICDKLILLVEHLKRMAEVGKKFPIEAIGIKDRANFTLFHNETIYTGNSILVVTDLGSTVYSTFTNPNYIRSNNLKAILDMDNWFNRITNKSELISLHAEKSRELYFNQLKKKINKTRVIINRFITEDK